MKTYYYNQKTQDLCIYDTETRELLLLEKIIGLRVFTSSELGKPVNGSDNIIGSTDFNEGGGEMNQFGRTKRRKTKMKCGYCRKTDHNGKDCPNKPGRAAKTKRSGKRACRNCGELGHLAKTCKNAPRSAPPQSPELPPEEIEKIVREERSETVLN